MVNEFCGFRNGVIGKDLPSDSTLNNMKKADLIKLLHTAQHNYESLMWFYNNAVKWNMAQLKNTGWIPVEERYPDTANYILLSFSNFSIPIVGRYEEDENGGAFYAGDEDETLVSQDMFVNAWMPLVKPYRPDELPARTNGDRIRSMSNEELAQHILCPYDITGAPADKW